MRNGTFISLLVIAIVASAAAGYFAGSSSQRTTTSTLTLISTTSTTTSAPSYHEPPFIFLSASAVCSPGPCWGGPAYVFHCQPNLLSGPATTQTCQETVPSTMSQYPSYEINITIPGPSSVNLPWANCEWSTGNSTGLQGFGFCVPLNSTSFIMGIPSPPPA